MGGKQTSASRGKMTLVTDTVEKGKNEPTKIFACTLVEIGFP
jgi:hypothetical protein